MIKEHKYKNRYGEEYTFTILKNKDILWKGPFSHFRYSKDDSDNITMVDPSGGPYVEAGGSWFGLTVEGFEISEEGFLIKTKQR